MGPRFARNQDGGAVAVDYGEDLWDGDDRSEELFGHSFDAPFATLAPHIFVLLQHDVEME